MADSSIGEHAVHSAGREFGGPIQAAQLDQDRNPYKFAAKRFDQLTTGFHRAACGNQVIDEQNPLPRLNRILMHLEPVTAVLQVIVTGDGAKWQLARLAYGNETSILFKAR